jgi:hypothetical protein
MKYFEKRKLLNYREHLRNPKVPFPDGYLAYHKPEIDCLDWLIAYYEGRGGDPILYLEALIKYQYEDYKDYVCAMEAFNIEPLTEVQLLRRSKREISFLYNWIYHKKITGF